MTADMWLGFSYTFLGFTIGSIVMNDSLATVVFCLIMILTVIVAALSYRVESKR